VHNPLVSSVVLARLLDEVKVIKLSHLRCMCVVVMVHMHMRVDVCVSACVPVSECVCVCVCVCVCMCLQTPAREFRRAEPSRLFCVSSLLFVAYLKKSLDPSEATLRVDGDWAMFVVLESKSLVHFGIVCRGGSALLLFVCVAHLCSRCAPLVDVDSTK
jgi:hypothetical protein